MRLGVMGGTFDPIHLGHLRAAESVREALELEALLFVPAGTPPHRAVPQASPADRLEMVRLAAADHASFAASDLELKREGPSYTVDTLRALAQQRPEDALFLVVGSDAYAELATWKDTAGLLDMCRVAVVTRPDETVARDTGFGEPLRVHGPTLPISATEVRTRVREGGSVRYLVPDSVAAYIESRRLYR